MARQIVQTSEQDGSAKGWLTWWTISEQELAADEVRIAGRDANIPAWMIDRISGRTNKSAWMAATQLGAKGEPSQASQRDPDGSRARYLTRALNEETRVIIREVIDELGERVSVVNVALIYLMGHRFESSKADGYWTLSPNVQAEADRLIDRMEADYLRINGKVDSGRIRALVLDWLDRHFRVCVRGTGGVYFIPRPDDAFWTESVEQELSAISTWVTSSPISGLFSIVELFNTGATTMDTFRQSAIDELKGSLEDVSAKLAGWKANAKMNAGSLMFSSDQMVNRLDGIEEKLNVLQANLGEELGVIGVMLQSVRKEAESMRQSSTLEVSQARDARAAAREAAKQAKANTCVCGREFATERGLKRHQASCDKAKAAKPNGGKSGTARDRAKQAKL